MVISEFIKENVKHNASFVTIILIVAIEVSVHGILSEKFISHEVDWTLRHLQSTKNNEPVVILGDSVGYGIFGGWNFRSGKIASLACNQATETAGQYFFLKRFLENNKAPGAVVICDRTPFAGNLNQIFTENYVQRCYTRWSEIVSLMFVKLDPVFTIKMITYKCLSTLKYRLQLQREFTGFTNSDANPGIPKNYGSDQSRYGIIDVMSKIQHRLQKETIAEHYFKKILAEMGRIDVPLYYIPPPSRLNINANHRLAQSAIIRVEELQKEYKNLSLIKEFYQQLSEGYFSDAVHLNGAGIELFRSAMQPTMEKIIVDAKQRQREKLSYLFTTGRPANMNEDLQSHLLQPWNDLAVQNCQSGLLLVSSGNDPALVFSTGVKVDKKRNERIMAKVALQSPSKTSAKLYFTYNFNNYFNEQNHITHEVVAGKNSLYFILPKEFTEGSLRFDPGELPGNYKLEKIEFKIVDANSIEICLKNS